MSQNLTKSETKALIKQIKENGIEDIEPQEAERLLHVLENSYTKTKDDENLTLLVKSHLVQNQINTQPEYKPRKEKGIRTYYEPWINQKAKDVSIITVQEFSLIAWENNLIPEVNIIRPFDKILSFDSEYYRYVLQEEEFCKIQAKQEEIYKARTEEKTNYLIKNFEKRYTKSKDKEELIKRETDSFNHLLKGKDYNTPYPIYLPPNISLWPDRSVDEEVNIKLISRRANLNRDVIMKYRDLYDELIIQGEEETNLSLGTASKYSVINCNGGGEDHTLVESFARHLNYLVGLNKAANIEKSHKEHQSLQPKKEDNPVNHIFKNGGYYLWNKLMDKHVRPHHGRTSDVSFYFHKMQDNYIHATKTHFLEWYTITYPDDNVDTIRTLNETKSQSRETIFQNAEKEFKNIR